MLHFIYHTNGELLTVTYNPGPLVGKQYMVTRNDFDTFDAALKVATDANLAMGIDMGTQAPVYLPVDRGNGTWPRYDIVEMPQVGDPVSRAFNGDSYPCGYIVKISNSLRRIETDDGSVFYGKQVTGVDGKKRPAGIWKETGGSPFTLNHGHHDRRNPHF